MPEMATKRHNLGVPRGPRVVPAIGGSLMKFIEGCANKITVPPGKAEVVIFDDALPGFGIRKFQDGRAVYFVRYAAGGTRRKLQLSPCIPGVLVAMRRQAAEIIAGSKRGVDPLAEKRASIKLRKDAAHAGRQASENSLGKRINEYLAKPKKRRGGEMKPRTLREVERHLRKQWAPLHDRDVATLVRRDLVKVIDHIAEHSGATTADRAKASMSAFIGWCLEREYIDTSPVVGILQRCEGKRRKRVLAEHELAAIWKACREDEHGAIVRLLMLVGARREEIGSLRWDEIDFNKRQIVLPESRTKNACEHTIPLCDASLAILANIPRRANRALVFGLAEGGFAGWSACKKRLDGWLGDAVAPWVLHDLRRSLVTHMNEHGFAQPHVVEAVVNHVSGARSGKDGVSGVYNRAAYQAEKRQALDRYGDFITGLVDGRPSNIVALRG
jgi:integrase